MYHSLLHFLLHLALAWEGGLEYFSVFVVLVDVFKLMVKVKPAGLITEMLAPLH